MNERIDDAIKNILRAIPRMDDILSSEWGMELVCSVGREASKGVVDELLAEVRGRVTSRLIVTADEVDAEIERLGRSAVDRHSRRGIHRVVNATGVVIHTNLGRAPLPQSAAEAAARAATAYCDLEYDLDGGERGRREDHVEWMLGRLTGAEASLVVNNNAGAVLLAISALAAGREVIISAGELVEIGGSFRIPEILSFSGAKTVIVGCTNMTRIDDYRRAITDDTAVLLKVHPSNYRVEGYTAQVSRDELAALARERGLLFVEDLGSGLIESSSACAMRGEPTVRECAASGVDALTYSGDKLLGGPQMGIISGRRDVVDRMRSHQLVRALRVDKMALAAFEEVLRLHLRGDTSAIPTAAMLSADDAELRARAERLRDICSDMPFTAEVVRTIDAVGGGAYPSARLDGWGVALSCDAMQPDELASRLRRAPVPVVPVINGGRVLLHVRALLDGDDDAIVDALRGIVQRS